MLKKLVLFSLISIVSAEAFGASLLRDPREVFAEPAKGGISQVLLGLSELGVAKAVWPGLAREEQALANAEKELALVRRTPTSEAEKIFRIEQSASDLARTEETRILPKVVPANPSVPTITEEIQFLSRSQIVTVEERAALIAAAEVKVAEQGALALKAAQEAGYIAKTLKILRVGTTVLIGTDVAARLYVWTILDANPGFTPVIGYSAEQLRALLN